MENIKVKYKFTSIIPYRDLEDGTPDFHHTSAMTISHNNSNLKDLLYVLSSNSKIGQIVDFEFELLKTSDEWYKLVPLEYNLLILDPDGWDRKNYQYSFNEELITESEFKSRVSNSTCQCSIDYFTQN